VSRFNVLSNPGKKADVKASRTCEVHGASRLPREGNNIFNEWFANYSLKIIINLPTNLLVC
jgi:hypothetical protein